MPTFFEVFGIKASELHESDLSCIVQSVCPYSGGLCDGGGNRHQTKISIKDEHSLRVFFDTSINSIVPAVCSIDYGNHQWVVCPRRLMGFQNETDAAPEINKHLQKHEREAFLKMGLQPGITYGIWPEVYLQYSIEDTEIDYHFDFIVAPIVENVPIDEIVAFYGANSDDKIHLVKAARLGKNYAGGSKDGIINYMPDLATPIIVEIMTASTSGSNTLAGTNISAAFQKLFNKEPYQSPGINKRQVWGRMATQLFAKSALANFWDGKTYWVVQDQLLKNIELTTKLNLRDSTPSASHETINFISMKYSQGINMIIDKVSIVDAGLSFQGNDSCVDILLPKAMPPKIWLLKSILRRKIAARIRI